MLVEILLLLVAFVLALVGKIKEHPYEGCQGFTVPPALFIMGVIMHAFTTVWMTALMAVPLALTFRASLRMAADINDVACQQKGKKQQQEQQLGCAFVSPSSSSACWGQVSSSSSSSQPGAWTERQQQQQQQQKECARNNSSMSCTSGAWRQPFSSIPQSSVCAAHQPHQHSLARLRDPKNNNSTTTTTTPITAVEKEKEKPGYPVYLGSCGYAPVGSASAHVIDLETVEDSNSLGIPHHPDKLPVVTTTNVALPLDALGTEVTEEEEPAGVQLGSGTLNSVREVDSRCGGGDSSGINGSSSEYAHHPHSSHQTTTPHRFRGLSTRARPQ